MSWTRLNLFGFHGASEARKLKDTSNGISMSELEKCNISIINDLPIKFSIRENFKNKKHCVKN